MTLADVAQDPGSDWSDPRRTDTRATLRPVGHPARASDTLANRAAVDRRRARSSARPAAARPPRVPFAVLVVSLVVGGMALLLVLNTASAANELDRHGFAAQDAGVAAQVQQLQNEVAASAAPANLARAAQGLGMVPAANPAFLIIAPDGSVVVRGSAAPAAPDPVQVPPAKPAKKPAKKPTKAKPTKTKPRKTTPTKATPTKTTKTTPTHKPTHKPTSGGGHR